MSHKETAAEQKAEAAEVKRAAGKEAADAPPVPHCAASGKFVSYDGTRMILSHEPPKSNTAHRIDATAAVTVNGVPGGVADLKPGDLVTICVHYHIEATR